MSLVKKLETLGKIKKTEGEMHTAIRGLSSKAKSTIVNSIARSPELKRTWLMFYEINRIEKDIEQNPLLVQHIFMDRNRIHIGKLFNMKMKTIANMSDEDLKGMRITLENLESPYKEVNDENTEAGLADAGVEPEVPVTPAP
jgi:hypothetical protein